MSFVRPTPDATRTSPLPRRAIIDALKRADVRSDTEGGMHE